MKIVVDYDRCASSAVCMSLAPGVFQVRSDGFLYVLDEHPSPDLLPMVEMAVRSCPTDALSIEDEP